MRQYRKLRNYLVKTVVICIQCVNQFTVVAKYVNLSAVEIEGRKIYTNSCFTTCIIQGTMSNRVKDFLYLDTKKRVLINGENGSNIYFYKFDFLKIHFLTSDLANYINLVDG